MRGLVKQLDSVLYFCIICLSNLSNISEYSQTYAYKDGFWPTKWIQKTMTYYWINLQLCEFKCNQESSFTCVAIAFDAFSHSCTLLSYSTVDHPECFIDYNKSPFFKFYERGFVASK